MNGPLVPGGLLSQVACSTCLAIGPATRAPVASLTPGWSSTTTDTATVGAWPGGPAKAIIQALIDAGSSPISAVPVLPPTSKPGILQHRGRAVGHHLHHRVVDGLGRARRVMGVQPGRGVVLLDQVALAVADLAS